ncbi:hypothetical protein FHU11_3401 [Serratia fonticola]|nr:hypothetical protein FHU11_3401 [Serratia fonticola]
MGQITHQRAGRQTRIFTPEEVSDIQQPVLAGLDRTYRYDNALNLVAANDERERLSYVVNGNRQVVSVSEGSQLQEHYRYDACGYPVRPHCISQPLPDTTHSDPVSSPHLIPSYSVAREFPGRQDKRSVVT